MVRGQRQLVCLVAAWAALAAQAVRPAASRGCTMPCCSAPADRGGPAPVDSAAGCPVCAGADADDHHPADAGEQPCRCQLDARQDEPIATLRGSHPSGDQSVWQAAAPGAVSTAVPQAVGVSREYLAATLAVPIRPARILFGVWRN